MPIEYTIDTDRKTQVVDVTSICQASIAEARNGLALINVMHSTAALIICEDEPNLRDDLIRVVEQWLADFRPFRHGRFGAPNAEAHITSALTGTSVTLPIVEGVANHVDMRCSPPIPEGQCRRSVSTRPTRPTRPT